MPNYKASIRIQLRKQILDVQGKTVEQALHTMEFSAITDVHIGTYVELTVAAASAGEARQSVEDACKRLIANPVMEDFYIELTPSG